MCLRVINNILFFFCTFVFVNQLNARELYNRHSSVRALGMGGAFIAVVDDSESLFFNPAGLARINGVSFQPFKIQAGANSLDAYDRVTELQEQADYIEALRSLYGPKESLWAGLGGYSSVTVPYFGIAAYDSFNMSADLSNPALPDLELNYINDLGGAVGFAFDFIPKVMSIGFVGKYIQRKGATLQIPLESLATVSEDDLNAALDSTGTGYAVDVGINLTLPTPVRPTFSFVWKNVGNTKFELDEGTQTPPTDYDEMIAGMAFEITTPAATIRPCAEYRYLNEQLEDIQTGKKIHVGVEVDLPILTVRGGLSQGYWTAGGGLDFGLFRVEGATYGVELGEYPGQHEDRRWMVEVTMDLGFDFSKGSFLNLDKTSQRRLKQRR